MRVAVISDVHGNCLALEAVLADLAGEPIDRIVGLGDMIQGGPQPAATVARLRELGCPVVMGNADAWLLTGSATSTHERVTEQQLAVREWSLAQLSQADRQFIAGLAPTVEVPLGDGCALLCCHGSPRSFDDILLPDTPEAEFRRRLGELLPNLICGGHTHVQYVRQLGGPFFFNPGSVGFAYRHGQPPEPFRADPWAEYAVLTVHGQRIGLEFRRVPFDVAAYRQVILASGSPHAETAAARYG